MFLQSSQSRNNSSWCKAVHSKTIDLTRLGASPLMILIGVIVISGVRIHRIRHESAVARDHQKNILIRIP